MTTTTSVEVCSNCLRPTSSHRPWCAEVQTTSPPKEGDMVEHPLLGRVPLLSVYSRQQAIEDGTLVDCTQDTFDRLNRDAGLKFDVAMTAAAFDRYVAISDELKGTQDLSGRYWDIVWMFRNAALKAGVRDELLFKFHCIPNGEGYQRNEKSGLSGRHRLVTLKAVCGTGDRGEPCMTFMLPDED
jgi:hypothetical protein